MDSPGDAEFDSGFGFALGEGGVGGDDVGEFVLDKELVGVWVWRFGLAELVDGPGADLEVLL